MTTAARGGSWLDQPDFAAARGALVRGSIGWLCAVGLLVYGLYLATGLAAGNSLRGLAPDAAILVALAVLLAAHLRGWVSPRRANLVLAALLIASAVSYVFTILADPRTFASPVFLVMLLATGLLVLSWPAFCASALVALGAWWACGRAVGEPLLNPFLGFILPGLGLGVVMQVVRMRTYAQLYRLHQVERERTAALKESEARWRGLIENMPETLAIVDRDGTMELVHRPGETTRSPDVARLGDGESPRDALAFRERLRVVFEEGRPVTFEMPARSLHGDVGWYSVSAGPIRDGSDVTKAVLLATDVTDRRREGEALRQAEKLSSLGTLVAGVAHEINNPLTYIRGNLELNALDLQALLPTLDEGARATVQGILDQQAAVMLGIGRIEHITQSLKRVARSRHGARKPEDVNLLVDGVLTVAGPRLSDQRVLVDLRASQRVVLDASEVSQVLLNLVFNALDALKGRADGIVRVSTEDVPGGVAIEVEDNGPGIPQDVQAQIFTPFKTTKPQGTGLGLSISHRIVADHGGTIAFATEAGRGTTFRVVLPASAPAPAAA